MEDDYCVRLQRRADATYAVADGRRRLLDLVETAVFDFLIANGDRHHYEFADGYPDAAVLLLDNGKRCLTFTLLKPLHKQDFKDDLPLQPSFKTHSKPVERQLC